jgi:protein SCO1/2
VDPLRDSFQVLRRYADKFDVDQDGWSFLTGDKSSIYQYARKELRVATPAGDGGADDFIHSEKIIVLDRNRFIRGYYDGLDTADIKKCADDIVLLTLEKNRKK